MSPSVLHLGTEFLAWSRWLPDEADRVGHDVIDCRWVAELPDVLLCGGSDQGAVGRALSRPSIFIENRPRIVVRNDDPLFLQLLEHAGGFDLRRHHPTGPDLGEFFAAVDRMCEADRALCAEPAEAAMRALVERAWADRAEFVLLAFSARGTLPADAVVSHEILHAQYFTEPAFRRAIDDYWAGLPEAARARVRRVLGPHYNAADDELMRNELQAFALMTGPRSREFVTLADHREPLSRLLATRGIARIAVQREIVPSIR